jgi:hypothetical protein
MIPNFITISGCPWRVLPPGVHDATLSEVYQCFVTNQRRKELYDGLELGLGNLFQSGCPQAFLDGSYVTDKPIPGDYEVCWDGRHVDPAMLDPVFLDFSNERAAQKAKYGGEYFPSAWIETGSGKTFLDFFQNEKTSGNPKGIIRIIKP